MSRGPISPVDLERRHRHAGWLRGRAMMAILTLIAEIIGFVVLGLIFLLGLLTLGSAIHEFIRSHSLAYDRYWYDETGRWNRPRQKPQEDFSELPPDASGPGTDG
jgi:hypothetical protein